MPAEIIQENLRQIDPRMVAGYSGARIGRRAQAPGTSSARVLNPIHDDSSDHLQACACKAAVPSRPDIDTDAARITQCLVCGRHRELIAGPPKTTIAGGFNRSMQQIR